jgi:hypothetical protein
MMTHRVVAPRSIASAKCCHLKPSGENAGLRRTQRTLPIPTEGTAAPACRDAPQGPSHLVSPGSPHWGEPDRPIARHAALPQAATSLLASRCFALHYEPLGAARREPSPRAVPAATARHSGDSTESHRIASAHEHVGHSAGSLQRRAVLAGHRAGGRERVGTYSGVLLRLAAARAGERRPNLNTLWAGFHLRIQLPGCVPAWKRDRLDGRYHRRSGRILVVTATIQQRTACDAPTHDAPQAGARADKAQRTPGTRCADDTSASSA